MLGAYGAEAARGALLVVPTPVDAHHYRRELAAAGVVFGSVLTFSGLAQRSPAGLVTRPPCCRTCSASGSCGPRCERAALRGAGRLERRARLSAAAGELIAELQRELVTPAAIRGRAAQLGRGRSAAPALRRRSRAHLSGVRRELERRGRVDRELYAWRALDALRARPRDWGSRRVFFYGFDELTALQRDAVETLSRIVGVQVTVSLTYEAGRAALRARAEAVEELTALAERVRRAAGARRALRLRLARRSAPPRARPVRAGRRAADRSRRGGGAARERRRARRGRAGRGPGAGAAAPGRPGRRDRDRVPLAATVGGAAGERVRAVRDCAAQRSPAAAAHTPLGRAVRGAARCALLDEHQARPAGPAGLPARARPARAPETRRPPRGRGQARWPADRRGCAPPPGPAGAGSARARRARRLRAAGRASCAGSRGGCSPPRTAAARAAAGRRRGARRSRAGDAHASARGAGRARAGTGGTRAGGAARGAGGRRRRLRGRGRGVARRAAGDPGPALPGRVRVRPAGGRVPAAAAPRAVPVRRAPPRARALARACACAPPRTRSTASATCSTRRVSRATERVVLSYRSSDEEGNLALPSPFVADVAELFAEDWPSAARRRLLADVVWARREAPTERERERSLAAARAPPRATRPSRPYAGPGGAGAAAPSPRSSPPARSRPTPTARQWLVERELRPSRCEPEPEPIVRGNVMHDVLERLLAELDGPVTPDSLPRAREILDRAAGASSRARGRPVRARRRPPRGRARRARCARSRPICAATSSHEARDRRRLAAVRRSSCASGSTTTSGRCRPLELGEGERAGARSAALIDRVDVDGAAGRWSATTRAARPRPGHPVARWAADRQLQVALYMLVVRELTELRAGRPASTSRCAATTCAPAGCSSRGRDVGALTVPSRRARAATSSPPSSTTPARRAVALAAALRAGALTPCPQTCSRDGCAYPGICRSQ